MHQACPPISCHAHRRWHTSHDMPSHLLSLHEFDNMTSITTKTNETQTQYSLPKDIAEDIQAELQKCYRYSNHAAKIALYAHPNLDFSVSDLTEIAAMVHHIFFYDYLENQAEAEIDEGCLHPAPNWATPAGNSLPELLRYHVLKFDKGWHDSAGNNQGILDWYPFGFAVVTSRDWRSDGVVLVHCDHDYNLDRFTAKSCTVQIEDVGSTLFALQQGEDLDWWRL